MSDRTINEMLLAGMEPTDVWEALDKRPIPSTLDLTDMWACVGALVTAMKECGNGGKTRADREGICRGMSGVVAFGLYVGKIAERMSQTPAVEAMVRVANKSVGTDVPE